MPTLLHWNSQRTLIIQGRRVPNDCIYRVNLKKRMTNTKRDIMDWTPLRLDSEVINQESYIEKLPESLYHFDENPIEILNQLKNS